MELKIAKNLEARATGKIAREQLSRSAAELRRSRLVANPSAEDLVKRSENARVLGLAGGALGGASRSAKKSAAARVNGTKGGRPRKVAQ